MKKIIITIIVLLSVLTLIISCGDNGRAVAEATWQKERDSMARVNTQQQAVLDQMTAAMAEIAFSLDTIAAHERVIISGVDEEGNRLSRRALRSRLEILAQVINEQKEKLGMLEEKFSNSAFQIGQLHSIIEFLESSLSQKDVEVEKLKSELNSRSYNVAVLEEKVANMRDTIEEERAINSVQKDEIAKQDAKLNEVYYIVANEESLVNAGILKKEGKIIKKRRIDFSNVNKSMLYKVDIRKFTNLTIRGRSPKILSDVPKDSYELTKNSDSMYTLKIISPTAFWSSNNRILVIQVKD
ncbi:MAG: hypothetical protein K2L84_00205 [Muribaculaceae bacterium]|nr:hypothetical protein [Muribaculaceae bacterium]